MEEGAVCYERNAFDLDLLVFILIHFFHAQTEHDAASSPGADAVLAQTDATLVVFVFQHGAKLFEHVVVYGYAEHDVLR